MTEQAGPKITGQQVLDVPLERNDAKAATVRQYLTALLAEVWRLEESFSGKRPFGNSGWSYEVYGGLLRAGLVQGSFDEDGYVDDVDITAADHLVQLAIGALGEPPEVTP